MLCPCNVHPSIVNNLFDESLKAEPNEQGPPLPVVHRIDFSETAAA